MAGFEGNSGKDERTRSNLSAMEKVVAGFVGQ